jgi:hypothetical protein
MLTVSQQELPVATGSERETIHVGRSAKQSKRPKLHERNPSLIMGILRVFRSPPPLVDIIGLDGFAACGLLFHTSQEKAIRDKPLVAHPRRRSFRVMIFSGLAS